MVKIDFTRRCGDAAATRTAVFLRMGIEVPEGTDVMRCRAVLPEGSVPPELRGSLPASLRLERGGSARLEVCGGC